MMTSSTTLPSGWADILTDEFKKVHQLTQEQVDNILAILDIPFTSFQTVSDAEQFLKNAVSLFKGRKVSDLAAIQVNSILNKSKFTCFFKKKLSNKSFFK